jgi:glyoxylase-like metal-dependent hydrolase (beta-lactamase superfamily II)
VVVDPGDPSDEAADAIASVAAMRGGSIRAIAVTAADPERAAGGEGLALRFEVPLIGPAAAVRLLAAEVGVVGIGDVIGQGDVSLAVEASPDGRADAVRYRVEGTEVVLGAPAGP